MSSMEPFPAAVYSPLRGIAYMCLAAAMLPFMNACAKFLGSEIGGDFPTAQIVWARYAGHLLFIVMAFMPTRGPRLFATRSPGTQVFRSLLLLTSTVLYFAALQFLPLAMAAAINFTAPFIVIALSVPVLGERVDRGRWLAVIIGFVGTLIIIRPGMDTPHWSVMLVIGCAISYALFQVMTRKLAGQDDQATTIAYTAIVGTIASSIVLPFEWRMLAAWDQWLAFISIGFFGGFGHYFAILAYRYAQASQVAPLIYGQLIGSVIIGFFMFGEVPDAMTWQGAAIIVASGLFVVYWSGRSKAS